MSDYLKQRAAEQLGRSYSPKDRGSDASQAWYADVSSEQTRHASAGTSETIHNAHKSMGLIISFDSQDGELDGKHNLEDQDELKDLTADVDAIREWTELNGAIYEVENLVKALNAKMGLPSISETIHPSELAAIERLREENVILKQRIADLEEERKNSIESKIENSGVVIGEEPVSPSKSSLPIARLRNVTAALNKALNSKINLLKAPSAPSSPK
jgi:Zn-dependent M16 (insulinase) family peptidase